MNHKDYERVQARAKGTPRDYTRANAFLRRLRNYIGVLSPHEIETLRGQALTGELEAAENGLLTVLRRRDGRD